MKSIITYLRHGLLYYHFAAQEDGELAGPLNYMFPLTPIGLHKGWIEGRERLITAVSGRFRRVQSHPPKIRCFDILGRPITTDYDVIEEGNGNWLVDLRMSDWAEVTVVL